MKEGNNNNNKKFELNNIHRNTNNKHIPLPIFNKLTVNSLHTHTHIRLTFLFKNYERERDHKHKRTLWLFMIIHLAHLSSHNSVYCASQVVRCFFCTPSHHIFRLCRWLRRVNRILVAHWDFPIQNHKNLFIYIYVSSFMVWFYYSNKINAKHRKRKKEKNDYYVYSVWRMKWEKRCQVFPNISILMDIFGFCDSNRLEIFLYIILKLKNRNVVH